MRLTKPQSEKISLFCLDISKAFFISGFGSQVFLAELSLLSKVMMGLIQFSFSLLFLYFSVVFT